MKASTYLRPATASLCPLSTLRGSMSARPQFHSRRPVLTHVGQQDIFRLVSDIGKESILCHVHCTTMQTQMHQWKVPQAQHGSWAAHNTQNQAVTLPPLQVVYPALDVKVKNVTPAYTVEHEDEERLFDQLSALIGNALVQQGRQRGVTLRALVCKVRLPGPDGQVHVPAAGVCPHRQCYHPAEQATGATLRALVCSAYLHGQTGQSGVHEHACHSVGLM